MSSPPLSAVVQQVADEVLRVWWEHDEQGTGACIPHLEHVLPTVMSEGADAAQRTAILELLSRRLAQRFGQSSRLAARAIQRIGPPAAAHVQIIPLLLEKAGDSRSATQEAAVEALGALGAKAGDNPRVRTLLLILLQDPRMPIAVAAVRALQRLSESGDPELRRSLTDAAAGSSRLRYLLTLIQRDESAAPTEPVAPACRLDMEATAPPGAALGVSVVARWAEELDARDPATRARAARRLAEAGTSGLRIFGTRRQIRVVTHRQLQYTAALQRPRPKDDGRPAGRS